MTLYEKRGRRYYPVREEVIMDSYPEGAHLVIVKPGLRTVTRGITPDYASLIAAANDARDAMCKAILEAMKSEPDHPLTAVQRKKLDAFIAAGGTPVFRRRCAADIADAGIKALIEAARK